MQPADRVAFVKVLNGMAALKPNAGGKLMPESIDLYWRSMQDWSIEDFTAAAAHLLKHHPYPSLPLPADFEKLRRAGEPTADETWQLVLSGAALPCGSRAWRAAQTFGGQQQIRRLDVERSLPFVRNKFIEAYGELTKVDPVREAVPQIAMHGARSALSAPANIAASLPLQLTQRSSPLESKPVALPAPTVASTAPKVAATPTTSAREKIDKLLPLGWDDEVVAKIAGECVDVVRQVRAERERAA